jgi:lysophospholipase L1-like esterase
MRPVYLFIFLLSLCLGLMIVFNLIPEDQKILGYSPRTFRIVPWINGPASKPTEPVNAKKLLFLQAETDQLAGMDSVNSDQTDAKKDSLAMTGSSLPGFYPDSVRGIQFPGGDTTLFQSFFRRLDSADNGGRVVRILHFGDSQIEGDRITGYLRQRFQQLYGGCGPGLLPFYEESPSRMSVEIKSGEKANRYFLYGKSVPARHNKYSVLHSVYHLHKDTGNADGSGRQSFSYSVKNQGFSRAAWFEKATIMFRNPVSKLKFTCPAFSKEKIERVAYANDSLKMLVLNAGEKKKSISIAVEGNPENDFYGVCLDGVNGVAVDNIPLRGSSGLELLKINPRFLQEQIRRLNVKMVILQFGVNVVPYDSPSFSWYENSLVRIIQTLKQADPELQVLVIGVSDMAKKTEGQWQSYSNIDAIRRAQKNAAFRTKSAFWDLYEVMGGRNSIVAWAGTNPPLAGKDYIHLTPRGAQVIGEFLFQALEKVKKQSAPGI